MNEGTLGAGSAPPHLGGWLFRDELTVEARMLASLSGRILMWTLRHPDQHIARGPFFHSASRIHLAAFVAGSIGPNTPAMSLHYDDRIAERDCGLYPLSRTRLRG
jgi:hypothetical protein